MAVNHQSGRVVVDIDPHLKRALHAALTTDGRSLKEWFVQQAYEYLDARRQNQLPVAAEPAPPAYGKAR